MRLTMTVTLDIVDDATEDEINRLIGAVWAQVEDDEEGILTGFRITETKG